MKSTLLRSAFVASLTASLLACPPVSPPNPLEKAPSITSFTASQTLVNAGDMVTLTWATADATEVQLAEAALGAVSGVDGLSGSVDVAVSSNAVYVLTARNSRGATHRAVVAINVRGAMGDVLLTAMPTAIDVGEEVTLAWSAPEASTVTITAEPGGAIDTQGQTAVGTVQISPTRSTTYTLTAGPRTAQASVTVRPTLLTFTSSTQAIDPNAASPTVTLSWTTANASRVRLSALSRGQLLDTADAGDVASGSFTDTLATPIDASRVFSYELRVDGDGLSTTRTLTLPVLGRPIFNTVGAPRFARPGDQVTVSWSTSGADAVSVYRQGVEVHRSPNAAAAAAGDVTLPMPDATLTLELVARNSRAGESRQMVTVERVAQPQVTLTASPATVALGEPFTLSWSGTSVRSLTVYGADGRKLLDEPEAGDTGTVPGTFRISRAQTYRVVADNTLGETAAASLTVTPSSNFDFTVSPAGAVRSDTRVELSWPGGETLYGFAHDDITLRPGSTGFDDISVTGQRVVFPGTAFNDEVAAIDTTFRAPLFGRLVGEVISVSTNGYVTFGPGNRLNTLDVVLPSAVLEPMSLAPYWENLNMATGSVHWQVKPVTGGEVLIVQWTGATTTGPVTNNTFQLKLFSTGQVDFEYLSMVAVAGKVGVQGPRVDEGYAVPGTPVNARGVTLFAPKQSPVHLRARSREPYSGFIQRNGEWVEVQARLDVVHPEDLQLGEALVEPASAVGAEGRWVEFFNARSTPIDLTGWNLTLADGGTLPLSGSVAANAVRVFGVSADRALNDDAGVDVALPGFEVSGDVDSFVWGRGDVLGTVSWSSPPTGIAQVTDYGPYRYTGDLVSQPSRPQTCFASATYGGQSPVQRGTPGVDRSCGFGYRWERVSAGYVDISRFGDKLVGNTTALSLNIDLSSAPFRFLGTTRNAVRVSSEGYLTFDLAASNNSFAVVAPVATAPNSVLAVFADDMRGAVPEAGIFAHRFGTNEDPFNPAPHWTIQWHHWEHVTGDDLNFQAKLFDDGVVEYHYGVMVSGAEDTPYGTGISANAWVENAAGSQALSLHTGGVTPGISPFTAYRISPR